MQRVLLAAVLMLGCANGAGDESSAAGDASVDSGGGDATKPACDPTGSDCGPDQYCNATTKKCELGCANDKACSKGRCDTSTHTCVACLGNGDCRPEEICSGKTCVAGCTPTRACPDGLLCCEGGCIDPTTNPDHCGGCGKACVTSNGVPKCSGSACKIASCSAPFADCDSNVSNGCEADTSISNAHCGGCGKPCEPKNATGGCTAGVCKVGACNAGFGDCNANPADGCEANFATDPSNCGGCGKKPTESCNLADDDCNGKCDDLDGCRLAVHRSKGPEYFYTANSTEAACCGYTVEALNYYYLYSTNAPGTATFYRCYNSKIGRHFYTTSATCEAWGATALEGPIGYIATSPICGSTPLYRLLSPAGGGHLFTTDASERSSMLSAGWTDEGIAGHVWKSPRG